MITDADILRARILIVDDQAANVSLLEQMLLLGEKLGNGLLENIQPETLLRR